MCLSHPVSTGLPIQALGSELGSCGNIDFCRSVCRFGTAGTVYSGTCVPLEMPCPLHLSIPLLPSRALWKGRMSIASSLCFPEPSSQRVVASLCLVWRGIFADLLSTVSQDGLRHPQCIWMRNLHSQHPERKSRQEYLAGEC